MSQTQKLIEFLNSEDGTTTKLFRSIDWSSHPLGPVENWSSALKTSLGILFCSRHPMFIWWGEELFQFYNDAYLPSLGKDKHPKAMGQKGKECWPENWAIIGPQIEGVMKHKHATWHEDQLVPIFRNGRIEDVYWTYGYSPIIDENNKVGGVLVICTETTKQVLAEQNLRAALTSRDTFLGVASHELKTPLTSIKLQAELSKRLLEQRGIDGLAPDKIQKLIDTTILQTERLNRLVNDMLDVSRINSGKLSISLSLSNLSTLVEDALARFANQFENAGCKLTKNITPNIMLQIDPMRIEQVVTNLVTNALKYAPGKPVHVEVNISKDMAKVSFKDGGKGINPEHQERIFGRFERAVSSADATGLGLGLYICKQIIQEHNGKISVESQPGEGSTFHFEIPIGKINN